MNELTFVKYCPVCNVPNPRQRPFCLECGEDISNLAVEPSRASEPASAEVIGERDAVNGSPPATRRALENCDEASNELVLELLEDPSIRFVIRDGEVVGRTTLSDVTIQGVSKWDYISDRMARFLRHGDQWYIQHAKVPPTNYIVVDGEKYVGNEEVAIYDGSIVAIPLTVFRICLKE